LARLGEGVLDLGEHLVADTLDLVAQLAEAQGALSESFDDQERPLVGDVREDLSCERVRAPPVRVYGTTP